MEMQKNYIYTTPKKSFVNLVHLAKGLYDTEVSVRAPVISKKNAQNVKVITTGDSFISAKVIV